MRFHYNEKANHKYLITWQEIITKSQQLDQIAWFVYHINAENLVFKSMLEMLYLDHLLVNYIEIELIYYYHNKNIIKLLYSLYQSRYVNKI